MVQILYIKTDRIELNDISKTTNLAKDNSNFIILVNDLKERNILIIDEVRGKTQVLSIDKKMLLNYLKKGKDFKIAEDLIKFDKKWGFYAT